MHNILVAGAHGAVGKKIIALLNASQYFTPIAMVRKEEYLNDFKKQNIKAVMADLTGDLTHAFKNIDKVIFAAGSGGDAVIEVDQEGAKKCIDEAKKAGVNKFVMLSSLGADNPEDADDLKEYLKAKHNADEYLKQSGLNYSIVRPGTLNDNKGTEKIKLAIKLSEKGEISRDDVAQTLVRSLHDEAPNNVTFEIIQGDTPIGKAFENIG
ncbi:hypothetical protein LCGC14_1645560 [marine sediment metagenome]|uniref:SDR family oxidoreductase n=2 Tax=root TaxID=1 RepID=A0A831VVZ2_9FLAO|nr:SDR family oxidoreductase [Pricia sp.]HEA21859.1 SDR family oxidoreductase [Pricia antarctica]